MGRHSRRGRPDKSDTSAIPAVPPVPPQEAGRARGAAPGTAPTAARGPGFPSPRRGGIPPQGAPGPQPATDGTPARGVPRFPDGTPARGVPRFPDGTPAQGVPRFPDGTPARGVPRFSDGTPAHGVPRFSGGTPAHGVPRVRGGHPEQREAGGGWGEFGSPGTPGAPSGAPQGAPHGAPPGPAGPRIPRQRQEPGATPRQAYIDAFDADGDEDRDVFAPRAGTFATRGEEAHRADPYGSVTDWDARDAETGESPLPETEEKAQGKGGKGRAFTGIAAAAVTTVLAVVVAGQVVSGRQDASAHARSTGGDRQTHDPASRGDDRPTPAGAPSAVALTYDQKMARTYALGATLKGSGKFDTVPGSDKAPGKGRKYTYRVDVERGLGLDAELFAQAVQKTLNDKRSWAHGGARTFERISSGKPDFVITLASPGTTATWCAKSGLDTTEDNVSCDSASTERVMINAYRWAQGSETYGDRIHSYRQMLINHEVGHRLGYGHVSCDKDGELAPVMQQQTKFLDHDGIHCKANPWVYPRS
ncbi:DUF3152 domain-containing protein [Streptomyces sp. 142MFCol3.1]|uniref:DUF3152 domain-containing protein n=1 Tax=Streptomyces sp. 142MFCol3.1 TaxID=1172179 RepID=UPI00048B70A8|nr:DUF3152 domain-containing protein [Streptomyces sp. 142MFCol3.1]